MGGSSLPLRWNPSAGHSPLTAPQPCRTVGKPREVSPASATAGPKEVAPCRWGARRSRGPGPKGARSPRGRCLRQSAVSPPPGSGRPGSGAGVPPEALGAARDSESSGTEAGGGEGSRPDSSPNFSRPPGRKRRRQLSGGGKAESGGPSQRGSCAQRSGGPWTCGTHAPPGSSLPPTHSRAFLGP